MDLEHAELTAMMKLLEISSFCLMNVGVPLMSSKTYGSRSHELNCIGKQCVKRRCAQAFQHVEDQPPKLDHSLRIQFSAPTLTQRTGPWSLLSRQLLNTRLRVTSDPPRNPSLKLMCARGPLYTMLPSRWLRPDLNCV